MPEARDIELKTAPNGVGTAQTVESAREPELASRALARIQQCLEKAEDQRHKISASGALTKEQEAQLRESFHVQIKSEIAKIWRLCIRPISPTSSKLFRQMIV